MVGQSPVAQLPIAQFPVAQFPEVALSSCNTSLMGWLAAWNVWANLARRGKDWKIENLSWRWVLTCVIYCQKVVTIYQNCNDSFEDDSYSWFLICILILAIKLFQISIPTYYRYPSQHIIKFRQVINYNHVMPTRYSVDISFDKTNLNKELLKVLD